MRGYGLPVTGEGGRENNIFEIFVSEAHFCNAVGRHYRCRTEAKRTKTSVEFTQKTGLGRLGKGALSAEPPHFRFN